MTTQQKMTEAEQALQEWGIAYTKQDDGTIVVEGDIDIRSKGLTKLPDLSKVIVKGNFFCLNNQLTSLAGAPASVSRDFWCSGNQLTSLSGAPAFIGGHFTCYSNNLTSLAGAPAVIGANFYCQDNQLTSLEYAPQQFKTLQSDFGDFTSWNEVPEHLRISPETKEKEKQARLETLDRIGAASTQRQTFKPMPSIRFKAGPK